MLRLLVIQNIPIDKSIIDAETASYVYPKWACKLIGVRDFLMMKMTISFFLYIKDCLSTGAICKKSGKLEAVIRRALTIH